LKKKQRSLEEPAQKETREILDWGEDGKPIYKTDSPTPEKVEEENKPEASPPPATVDRASPESFNGFTDPKPHGPMSVGFDATFFGSDAVHLYGLAEHATRLVLCQKPQLFLCITHRPLARINSFDLKDTDGNTPNSYREPYRLYNLDVFEYELDEPMALYGSIPFVVSRDGKGQKSGLFLNNPSETYVDVATLARGQRATRWMSEVGLLFFLLNVCRFNSFFPSRCENV